MRHDLLSTDLIAALSGPVEPRPAPAGPDPDDLQRCLDDLADRHGDLEASAPDHNGSVRISCADGRRYRFTAESRMVPCPRSAHRKDRGHRRDPDRRAA